MVKLAECTFHMTDVQYLTVLTTLRHSSWPDWPDMDIELFSQSRSSLNQYFACASKWLVGGIERDDQDRLIQGASLVIKTISSHAAETILQRA